MSSVLKLAPACELLQAACARVRASLGGGHVDAPHKQRSRRAMTKLACRRCCEPAPRSRTQSCRLRGRVPGPQRRLRRRPLGRRSLFALPRSSSARRPQQHRQPRPSPQALPPALLPEPAPPVAVVSPPAAVVTPSPPAPALAHSVLPQPPCPPTSLPPSGSPQPPPPGTVVNVKSAEHDCPKCVTMILTC